MENSTYGEIILDYFYHGHIRSAIATFGTLFNELKVARRESDGSLTNQRTVPIAYGPRQKFLTRITERSDLPSENVAIKLPRISYQMTSLEYDSARQTSKFGRELIPADGGGSSTLWTPVPYKIGMELNVMSKNQDEGLQIIEQILPMFAPSLGFRVKPINGSDDVVNDIKITLQGGVSIEDQYEVDYTSQRVLIYTLKFSIILNLYRRVSDSTLIKKVVVKYRDFPTEDLIHTTEITLDPPDANEDDDDYEVVITEISADEDD